MKKATIQFTVTIEERERFRKHAERAGLTVSQFCKTSMFSRLNNYPLKYEKSKKKKD